MLMVLKGMLATLWVVVSLILGQSDATPADCIGEFQYCPHSG
jgi:hypothetical protein